MLRQYRANDPMSVARIARNLATTPKDAYPQVLGALYYHELMTPVADGGLKWVARQMLRLLRWRLGKRGFVAFVAKMQAKDDRMVSVWMAEVISHCLHGRDTHDLNAVGGWSQAEIDLLTSELKFSRDADEERLAKTIYSEYVLTQPLVPRMWNWDELPYEVCEPFLNLASMQMEQEMQDKLRREQASAHT